MRRATGRAWMIAVGLLPGCAPVPTEIVGSSDGTTDASTGPASTSATPVPGSTSAEQPEMSGSGSGGDGQGADTSSDGDTTAGAQLGTSTGETASTGHAATTGEEPGSSSGSPRPSCDELYGAAPGYVLCMETPDECHFAAQTNGGSCNAMCGMFRGTCIDAFDNSDACTILEPDTDDCDTMHNTEICVCSR